MKKIIFSLAVVISSLAGVDVFAASQLKTEAVNNRVSGIVVKQEKENGQTVISGSVLRGKPASLTPGAHIHVQLVDAQNRLLACKSQGLAPTAPRRDVSLGYRSSYAVTLSSAEAARADKVRVEYIANSHDECTSVCSKKNRS
ncbi:MAG: hypothetical protein LBH01_07380 [Verrucomicrobiales bacterium]|nr:hypothetical protein [Verrucomicrobiales bacterium]